MSDRVSDATTGFRFVLRDTVLFLKSKAIEKNKNI